MKASIQFLGGAGTVTGSKFLLEVGEHKILVDCGLFQGLKDLRLQNWAPLPLDPQTLTAVLLTHAHLDHSGYLPLLTRNGFSGKIFCTSPTRDLSKVILLDSAKIQEEDAERANQEGFSKHSPAKPLYTVIDAHNCLKAFNLVGVHTWIPVAEGVEARFSNSGHILGSSFIEVKTPDFTIVFSGDLGRSEPLILHPPEVIKKADYLVIESTYGDRLHSPLSPLKQLAQLITDTVERKGHVVIPSFAVGRTQDVLYLLAQLKKQSQIMDIPIYLDSPMGINATEIFADHPLWHRLSSAEVTELSKVATMVKSQQQSDEILHRKESTLVIAGSGMMTGGRVLTHLIKRLPDDRNTVVLVGFQAASTRGRLLRSGATEVKIYGQYIPVRARIEEISSLSAHGDQKDILGWLGKFEAPPRKTFIVHGEPQGSDGLRVKVHHTLNWECVIPKHSETFEL